MGLVVVTDIVKKFVALKALAGGFGLQNILEPYHLAKGFWGIAYILLEQPSQLPRADSRIQIGRYVQHT